MNRVITEFVENEDNKLQNAAYSLRKSIISIKPQKLPENLSVDDIIEGECQVPDELLNFMCDLIQSPDYRRKNNIDDLIRVKSICQDIIFCTTKGKVKPAKQLMLGLAVKSMTNSRKLLSILNNYSSSISYYVAEELETEMTLTACEDQKYIPSGIVDSNNLCTNVAFDNYYRFVDTINGKDTLHDTVGIVCQLFPTNNNNEIDEMSTSDAQIETVDDDNVNNSDAQVQSEGMCITSQETPEKPKVKTTLLPLEEIVSVINQCKKSRDDAIVKDSIWIFPYSHLQSTPM